jgi:hypothetical protein
MNFLQILLFILVPLWWILVIALMIHDRKERDFYKDMHHKLLLALAKKYEN